MMNLKSNYLPLVILLTLLYGIGISGQVYTIDNTHTLSSVATTIASLAPTDTSTQQIRFKEYSNVSQSSFKLISAFQGNIVFERESESDSLITIPQDSILFEFKRIKGTVTLRGLAFKLNGDNSVLIAGSETGKENAKLILDSCIIMGDDIKSTFISWLGKVDSRIEIRRSYFVAKNGTSLINLNAGTIVLENNAINFSGRIISSANELLHVEYNTVIRTQLDCRDGNNAVATFLNNWFPLRGRDYSKPPNTVGYFPIYFAGFFSVNDTIKNNLISNGEWKGFDFPDGTSKFSDISNKHNARPSSRDTTELWNWYFLDSTNVGFGAGPHRKKTAYNVFPDSNEFSTSFDNRFLRLSFMSSAIPRTLVPEYSSVLLSDTSLYNDLRLVWPQKGGLHFGAFKIFSIILDTVTNFGTPILLANQGATGLYKRQSSGSANENDKVILFSNEWLSAKYFHPAFSANTSKGINITPDSQNLGVGDSILFTQVTLPGRTIFVGSSAPPMPSNYRDLNVSVGYSTNAVLNGNIDFGTNVKTQIPYEANKVYWWIPSGDTLLSTTSKNGRFMSKYKAVNALQAYLVEVVNTPKGKSSLSSSTWGQIQFQSENGFQFYLDSTSFTADSNKYGSSSKPLKFDWAGRGINDSVIWSGNFKTPDHELWKNVNGVYSPVLVKADSSHFEFALSAGDSNAYFFQAIPFNVFKNQLFTATLGDVSVANLLSSNSGKISFANADPDPLDPLFLNTKWLGGKSIKTLRINLTQAYQIILDQVKAHAPSDKVKLLGYDGSNWMAMDSGNFVLGSPSKYQFNLPLLPSLPLSGISKFAILEVLPPAENIVTFTEPVVKGETAVTFLAVTKPGFDSSVIKKYGVQMFSLNAQGQFVAESPPDSLSAKPIGTALTKTLSPGKIYWYQLQYLEKDYQVYGNQLVNNLEGPKIKYGDLPLISPTAKNHWQIIGFPFDGLGKHFIKNSNLELDVLKFKDVSEFYDGIAKVTNNGAKDSSYFNKVAFPQTLKRASAYLFAASRPFNFALDSTAKFPDGKVYTTAASSAGWKFIGNPFPFPFAVNAIHSNQDQNFVFQNLTFKDTLETYQWDTVTVLQPFKGYAVYLQAGEMLSFDPFKLGNNALAKKSRMANLQAVNPWATLKIGEDVNALSGMTFFAGNKYRSIPNLPALQQKLRLKIGGGEGYLYKAVTLSDKAMSLSKKAMTVMEINESLNIFSDKTKSALLKFTSEADKDLETFALWNKNSGETIQANHEVTLQLIAGNNAYQFIAGDSDFVKQTLSALQANIKDLQLTLQNYPNPFNAQTQINFTLPAGLGHYEKLALEIINLQGIRIWNKSLNDFTLGSHFIAIEPLHWAPGVYVAKLRVQTDKKTFTIKRKMMRVP